MLEYPESYVEIITGKYRKRAQRGKGIKLMGIRVIESNFNPIKKTYNPHLHFIVANKEMAEILIKEWLSICTKDFARWYAQHMCKVVDKEAALIEVIKYGCKIFTEPEVNNKYGQNRSPDIYVAALDNIFSAMKGIRIFERFGFNTNKEINIEHVNPHVAINYQEWDFQIKKGDWSNVTDGSTLCGNIQTAQLWNILENNINKDIE